MQWETFLLSIWHDITLYLTSGLPQMNVSNCIKDLLRLRKNQTKPKQNKTKQNKITASFNDQREIEGKNMNFCLDMPCCDDVLFK